MQNKDIRCAFFGGEPLAVPVLEAIQEVGIIPKLIITNPDRKSGRSQEITSPPAKEWAQKHNIPVYQQESFKKQGVHPLLEDSSWDVFLVAAYPMILPAWLIDTPRRGTLNLHPSLLPKLRGPSPIRSAILEDMRETGVSIMHMDAKMDHGPIVAQEKIVIDPHMWPIRGRALDHILATHGANLFARIILPWVDDQVSTAPQQHSEATYTKKFVKADGYVDISDNPYKNLLKIRAFDGWPGTFFMHKTQTGEIRVKITDAELTPTGTLRLLKVIPEGKPEMDYTDFMNRYRSL